MCWIAGGSFFYGDAVEYLPFSTIGCENNTHLLENSTLLEIFNVTLSPDINNATESLTDVSK